MAGPLKIAIVATFTAEPLRDSLAFWSDKLQWQTEIAFAPYNQLFQELLDANSLLSANPSGINIILVRPEDWHRYDAIARRPQSTSVSKLLITSGEFVTVLEAAAKGKTTPYLVCLCPSAAAKTGDEGIAAAEAFIADRLANLPGVHLLRSEEVLSSYPVAKVFDPDRDEMGHIPFTIEFFTALGTALCRKIFSLQRNPYKVIVTDCDDTLWRGVCGEVGPHHVEIDGGYRSLQEFLIQQQSTGMLLCLCSKNVQEDVDEVFRCQTSMPLQPRHIIARRVNWRSKAENLRELAAELQLGLDSFIYLDDNPLECELLKAECPQVLTLQLPPADRIPDFLRNVWAFDKAEVTEEDRRRTALYRENQARSDFRQQTCTLSSFLQGLQLQIEIAPATPEQLPRLAQLTQRTNQFNCTTVRRTAEELRQLLQVGGQECLAVQVRDRFGDYGLVGAIIFGAVADTVRVDTFLLSCRVLGRGVEHAMLRQLGEIAVSRGLCAVVLDFVRTQKNAPALDFLENVAADFITTMDDGFAFRIPAAHAAHALLKIASAGLPKPSSVTFSENEFELESTRHTAASELIGEIATNLTTVESILRAIRNISVRVPAHEQQSTDVGNVLTPLEQTLAEIWKEVLGTSEIGPESDFFALGGDSLLATQVISRVRNGYRVRLHLSDLFNNPTVSSLASAITNASARSDAATTAHSQLWPIAEPIPRRSSEGPCELSFGQQRWWFLNQWSPGTADHLSVALSWKGKLNRSALELSLRRLLERHEVLRTIYSVVNGSPVQSVLPVPTTPMLHCVSLAGTPATQRELNTEKILNAEFRKSFDLASDLMLRACLIEIAEDDHALALVMHHIASDGWSRGILVRELQAAYRAYAAGTEPVLSDLPVQYADFSEWQRRHTSSTNLEDQLTYWKAQLAHSPAFLDLPTDRPRPIVPDLREGVHTCVLPNPVLQQLRALSQNEGSTLFMTLLAAFQTLLYRYSAQSDFVIGSPVAGRNHPDLEGLIGCFINMVAFRAQLSDELSFRDLLGNVRQTAMAAQERQDVPFERLVEETEQARDISRAPIFQVVFAREKLLDTPDFPGLITQLTEVETRSAFHDLTLLVAELSNGLRLRFEYRTELFESSTIQRLAGHFMNLLTDIVADPDQNIGSLSLLKRNERESLLHQWNDSQKFPVTGGIHELFEAQVSRVPNNIALSCDGRTMTYAELNAKANQLARYLSRMGTAPDVLVGICMERSLDLVIAILAILKAGGAYLPLDPGYPKERIAFMLEDAKPPVVITQYRLRECLPDSEAHVITLDDEWPAISRESTDNLDACTQPDNLAYVIFTSGSTGRPKGCQITHANVMRLFAGTEEWFRFDDRDVWTLFHSFAFDFSVWELWGALIYGGKLIIVPYLVSRSPEEFYRLLESERVTILNQTPSSFRQLMGVDETRRDHSLALRYVIFGGEALDIQSLQPWFQRHGDRAPLLINMYGITETTVHVTYRPLSLEDSAGRSVIGRPLPDLQLYILNHDLQPAPIGVPGEIYVGGAGVARGYLNRPELTAERFIPDRFQTEKNNRLYKTGDLARRLSNGDIEYLGRVDQQVKIRGFRIELGEIETILLQHTAVRETAVLLSEQNGEKHLVAYVVPNDAHSPSPTDLHSFLKTRLPEYMIPSAFVALARLPLTSNGKLDRDALPSPGLYRSQIDAEFIEPRTPIELAVAAAWKEVLGLERVGLNDNFFEIGGHSLLATRVIILLRNSLGLNFSLRLLFENPTVSGMTNALIEPLIERSGDPEVTAILDELESKSDEDVREISVGIFARGKTESTTSLSAAHPISVERNSFLKTAGTQ